MYMPITAAKIKQYLILPRIWSNQHSDTLLVEGQNSIAILQNSLVVYFEVRDTYDPEILLLDVWPRQMKTYVHTQKTM